MFVSKNLICIISLFIIILLLGIKQSNANVYQINCTQLYQNYEQNYKQNYELSKLSNNSFDGSPNSSFDGSLNSSFDDYVDISFDNPFNEPIIDDLFDEDVSDVKFMKALIKLLKFFILLQVI
jgi:hypothetical protein